MREERCGPQKRCRALVFRSFSRVRLLLEFQKLENAEMITRDYGYSFFKFFSILFHPAPLARVSALIDIRERSEIATLAGKRPLESSALRLRPACNRTWGNWFPEQLERTRRLEPRPPAHTYTTRTHTARSSPAMEIALYATGLAILIWGSSSLMLRFPHLLKKQVSAVRVFPVTFPVSYPFGAHIATVSPKVPLRR